MVGPTRREYVERAILPENRPVCPVCRKPMSHFTVSRAATIYFRCWCSAPVQIGCDIDPVKGYNFEPAAADDLPA